VTEPTPAKHPGLSVVIPAFRSPGTLRQVCLELDRHVAALVDELEVIFVDDGSGDETWATIQSLAAEFPWVRGLTLLRNFGQHNALLAGWRQARLPLVLTIDDDLQNPPDQVHLLLDAMSDTVDLVYGRPVAERQSWLRTLGPDVYPRSSAFRLFRRHLIEASASVQDPYISIDVLLSWATSRINDVPVEFRPRTHGRSGYTLGKLVRHALNMATGYSTRPLRWVSAFGFMVALFGFVLLTFVMVSYFVVGRQVAGFTFLASALSLFSGVQLLSLGVLGEYVGRIHFRSMGKPPYVIRETTETLKPPSPEPRIRNRSEAVPS
jgi:glycosyltransferase involved in cell wall biosynthesis